MARRKDDLTIVLTVGRRGLEPAHPVDLEALSQLPIGTQVEVVKVTKPRSKALVGWWETINITAKALERPPRSISNEVLLDQHMVERRVCIGGYTDDPMSLRDFTEDQLRQMTEMAKFFIYEKYGLDPDELIRNHKRLRGAA